MAGLREGTAAEAGLSARRLDRVRDLAAGWVKDGIHPAIVALVARHGVIALHEAYGQLGPEGKDPALSPDALWPLASLSKVITATALMMLVEDGLVGLTRPVREYIPEFAGGDKDMVCVHHLLNHTSGVEGPTELGPGVTIADVFTDPFDSPPRDPSLHLVVDRLLGFAYDRPLRGRAGEEMSYDTVNYELVGEIVRRVSGQPLGGFIQDRIFGPLGMTDSYWTVPDDLIDRLVRVKATGMLAFAWEAGLATVPSGGAAGCSTVRDMALFGQMFLDGGRGSSVRVLARSTVEAMVTNQIPGVPGLYVVEHHDEASWGYGWGIACHEKWNFFPTHAPGTFSHSGVTGTYLWCDPTNALVGAFFAPMSVDEERAALRWQADMFANAVTAAIDD